jgi:hypothetical protein
VTAAGRTRTCGVAVLAEGSLELGQPMGIARSERSRVCEQRAEPELGRHQGIHRRQLCLRGRRLLAQLLRQRHRTFRSWSIHVREG